MKRLLALIVLMVAAALVVSAQTNTAAGPTAAGSDQQNIMAASNSLKILSPTVGERIGSTTVSVRYQLTDSAASAASSPTYRVQLDGRDPAETLDTEYTFNGLKPGGHTLTVELVDANHTPITGSRTVVHFNTFTPGATSGTTTPGATTPGATRPGTNNPGATGAQPKAQTTGALAPPAIVKAKMPLPAENPGDRLPNAGGELPLLSMVGFGVLVGGVISALRTRK